MSYFSHSTLPSTFAFESNIFLEISSLPNTTLT